MVILISLFQCSVTSSILLLLLLLLHFLLLPLLLRGRLLLTLLCLAFRMLQSLTLHIVQIYARKLSGFWTRPPYQLLFVILLSIQSNIKTKGTSSRLRQIPFTPSPIHNFQYCTTLCSLKHWHLLKIIHKIASGQLMVRYSSCW